MHPVLIALFLLLGLAAFTAWWNWRRAQRERYIRHYRLPKGLYKRLQAKHPTLTLKDCDLVAQGLRQFFICYLRGGHRYVSMPSQVVDDLWHEFIIYTRNYELFCRQAFGRFLHHTSAVVLKGGEQQSNEGLRRCWTLACREENIDPRAPRRLPLLFALDTKFAIAEGYHYIPDCTGVRRHDGSSLHCGGDFATTSVDGSTNGFCDDSSGSSDGGGADSGGDSGCGGGCGGD